MQLRRTRAGAFRVEEAQTAQALQEGQAQVRPALAALAGFPVQRLDDDEVTRIARGIDVAATVEGAWGALTNPENGVLVALAERRADRWQPRVVMREA